MDTNTPEGHKFLEKSEMTYKDIFDFAHNFAFIPYMQRLAEEIGRDKFIEMLKQAGIEIATAQAKEQPQENLKAFIAFFKRLWNEPFWRHILTWEIGEETDSVFEWKVRECLWAKTFREANASDIGYATCCYGDFAYASACNPKLKLIREKTLMQGHDCCHFRYVWEE
jgi:hypothetical protein